jgi:hypothetical protein
VPRAVASIASKLLSAVPFGSVFRQVLPSLGDNNGAAMRKPGSPENPHLGEPTGL